MSKTYYISKYANDGTIKEVQGKIEGKWLYLDEGFYDRMYGSRLMPAEFAHETREEAEEAGRKMRAKKVLSLEKQIAKLQKIGV